MEFKHQAEWEWGWKAPLLFHFESSPPLSNFFTTPLEDFALEQAEAMLTESLALLKTSRLGIRFERIQSALLGAHPETSELRSGLVIPGRTEIDFLHRLKGLPETIIHWELAVKFYLGLKPEGSIDADDFIGPSLKDTLGKKRRTVFSRQLAVLGDPAVRAEYGPQFGIKPGDQVLALPKIHGVLFDPFPGGPTLLRPEGISPKSLRGIWASVDRLDSMIESVAKRIPNADTAFVRVLDERKDWIRDLHFVVTPPESETPLKNFFNSSLRTRIQSHFSDGGEPIQGAFLSFDGDSKIETRFFIVPTDWTSRAKQERIKI